MPEEPALARCSPVTPSVPASDGSRFALVRDAERGTWLLASGSVEEFHGAACPGEEAAKLCPMTPANAFALAGRFPWLAARRLPQDAMSFGFGDRLGLATPGHIRAVQETGIFPVLAQQSVRENARTGRSFADVLADAIFAAFREGFSSGFGADADHLKEISDALEAARVGYTFFTCDPGDHVVSVAEMREDEVRSRFAALRESSDLARRHAAGIYAIGDDSGLCVTEDELRRAAVKYGPAIEHAAVMYHALRDALPEGLDYEVSVDETDEPTFPAEHLFIALELRRRDVEFVSLAPRFVGAMEKGVDWRGDMQRFRTDLARHAHIAAAVGGYRLSLHSGSDKFSLYPELAQATEGRVHVKTAGTSYLVALEIVSKRRPTLFREIVAHSLRAFAEEQATYHISVRPEKVPPLDALEDNDLPQLVESHDSRQLLHVTYGSVLRGPLGDDLRATLGENEEEHFEMLAKHMRRHLDGLEVGSDDQP
ncbi:MAG: hypothetical protein JSW65_03660 [Candidatus Bipolaricaulota bacterium]|nr:MAG: hypothetical protein JSW65_03660 [Candidatus Bipolaricaulota bacterium]